MTEHASRHAAHKHHSDSHHSHSDAASHVHHEAHNKLASQYTEHLHSGQPTHKAVDHSIAHHATNIAKASEHKTDEHKVSEQKAEIHRGSDHKVAADHWPKTENSPRHESPNAAHLAANEKQLSVIPLAGHDTRVGNAAYQMHKDESVSQLAAHGFMKLNEGADAHLSTNDKTSQSERDVQKNPVKDIDVTYQDQNAGHGKSDPDFRVRRDGSVEVLHNPDSNDHSKITVELERNPGDRGAPPAAQQRAADDLVHYLGGRYMAERKENGAITHDGQIDDPQGLVSSHTKNSLRTHPSPIENLPQAAQRQIHEINRWHGAGGGRHHHDGGVFSSRQAGEAFPHRDVPRQPGEDDKVAALKDVAAGFISHGEKNPYHHVSRGEGGHHVGRYGITGHEYANWLKSMSPEQIQELIKEGKLPAGALDFAEGKQTAGAQDVQQFVDKLNGGQGQVSGSEIDHFMPKETQERIGTDLIKHYAGATADRDQNGKPTGINVGKVALSMQLGREATDADAKKPENQALMNAAQQSYPLALEHAMNGSSSLDMSDAGRKILSAAKADLNQKLWTNHAAATQYGNLGCAASVSTVLRDAGVSHMDETYVPTMASKLQQSGWHAHSFNDRRPGDVIIATSGGSHGHTGIVGEGRDTYDNHSSSGLWKRDDASYWGHWRSVYVLRPPDA